MQKSQDVTVQKVTAPPATLPPDNVPTVHPMLDLQLTKNTMVTIDHSTDIS